ncbi:MAG: helix-turn-helix domain-containing protein [Tetrasphaera sp.]
MRADARANREALLAAARQLYAARGTSAPFSQIAAEAGVGIGTLYRHFPTPDDLIVGLLTDVLEQVTAICRRHRERLSGADAAAAWRDVVDDLVALELGPLVPQLVADRALADLPSDLLDLRAEGLGEIERLLDLAKRAGLVRPDVTTLFFQAGLAAFSRPLPALLGDAAPGLRAWLVEVYLAGLRPTADDGAAVSLSSPAARRSPRR